MFEQFTIRPQVTIRSCQREDLQDLEWFGLFTPHRELILRAFERQENGDNVMLVAVVNSFPVGQVWIDLVRKVQASIGILWALRVMPPFQTLGIGTRLITMAEGVLKDEGFAVAEIGVEKDNLNAKRLYEKLGYQIVADNIEEWNYITPEGSTIHEVDDEWIMHKSI